MKNRLYALEHYEYIRISGADRISFLQGQVSCNTELLSAERSLCGALCNIKGRVIADFRLVQQDENIIMQCAAGMAEKILTTLSKYAVFSKVELELLNHDTGHDATSTPQALGLIADDINTALSVLQLKLPNTPDELSQNSDCSVIRLPGSTERIELWFRGETAKQAFLSSSELSISDDLQSWHRAEIEAGTVHVTAKLSEEYTPQLLNYDLSGLIDFKKGCYTGQEIVARMFYRGTAKKRLFLAKASHPISADSRLVSQEDTDTTTVGAEILVFSNCGTPSLLLAIVASDSAESGQVFRLSDQPDSEVTIQSLPYAEERLAN